MSKQIEITLNKSMIGKTDKQRKTAQALGLTKVNDCVVLQDTDAVRGMINVISHLVTVTEK